MAVLIERHLLGVIPLGAKEIVPEDEDSFYCFAVDRTPEISWIGRQKVTVVVDYRHIAQLKIKPYTAVPNKYFGFLRPDWIPDAFRFPKSDTIYHGEHRDFAGMLTKIRVVSK